MSARKIIIGCSAVALVTLAFLVIVGVVAFRRLSAPAPLPPVARLVDSECLGLAVAHLDPDDPWVKETMAHLSEYSTQERKPKEMFPVELVWTGRRSRPDSERHVVSLSLSRGGRFFGMIADLALWRAGRQDNGKVARVEYGGEGITSFPGTPLQGQLFVRDNSFIWSSDLDAAKQAIDLLSHDDGAAAATGVTVASLVPAGTGHLLAGAILNENGSLARSLSLVPGDSLDLPAETVAAVQNLTFTLDTSSATDGTGEIIMSFAPDTPAGVIDAVAKEMSVRLAAVKMANVTIEATPRVEGLRAVLAVRVGGLDSVADPLLRTFTRSVKQVESLRSGRHSWGREPVEEPAAASDPNQSSSTFQ